MNYLLKKANDAKLAHKEENDQWLDLKELMDKTILKLATLKSSTRLNMQQLREEHNEDMNATKENVTTENIQ